MPQDEAFPGVRGRGHRQRGALVEVVSDGLGFYIAVESRGARRLGRVRRNQRQPGRERRRGHVVSRSATRRASCAGRASASGFGCTRRRARVVVFIGDGTSDRYGAAHADLVFAKEGLARICDAEGWPFIGWDSFVDVSAEVERAFADGRLPASAEDLPRWRANYGHGPRPFICGPEVWGPGRTTPGPVAAPDRRARFGRNGRARL